MTDAELQEFLNPQYDTVLFSVCFTGVGMDSHPGRMAARQLQDSLDPLLEQEGLFADSPALARLGQTWETLKRFYESLPAPPASSGLDDLSGFLKGKTPWIIAARESLFAYFWSANAARAMLLVEGELSRWGILQFSKIGHYDVADHVCRTYYPKNTNCSFNEHAAVILAGFMKYFK